MPIIKSAKKKMRQAIVRTKRNKLTSRIYKAVVKKTKLAVKNKKLDEAKKLLSESYKKIDMAAKKKLLHKNTAARQKSRLAKLIKKASAKN